VGSAHFDKVIEFNHLSLCRNASVLGLIFCKTQFSDRKETRKGQMGFHIADMIDVKTNGGE
jgi:hypothetical protein